MTYPSLTKDYYLRNQEPYNENSSLKTDFFGKEEHMSSKLDAHI